MTVHQLEVRLVRSVAWVLALVVGVPLLLVGTVVLFVLSLVWPTRLLRRWGAMLRREDY